MTKISNCCGANDRMGCFGAYQTLYSDYWLCPSCQDHCEFIDDEENQITTKTMETKIKKPKVKLTGEDGNVFNLLGLCSNALKKNNQIDKAREMSNKVFDAKSYDEALRIMGEYCEIS